MIEYALGLMLAAAGTLNRDAVSPCPHLKAVAATAKPTQELGQWVVLVNATTDELSHTANKVVSFPTASPGECSGYVLTMLRSLANGDVPASYVDSLRADAAALAEETSTRWISHKGNRLAVFVIMNAGATATIDISEVARASRIETDFASLLAVASKLARTATKEYDYAQKTYFLERGRATLKVSTTVKTADGKSVAGTDGKNGEVAIVTGPPERLFLSANIGSTDARQTTYDQATRSLTPPKSPKEFYIGGNWSFGDLYGQSNRGTAGDELQRLWNSLYVGMFVEGSDRPFSQFGFLLGTRYLPYLDSVLPLQSVSPYIGFVRVRNDTATATPGDPLRRRYGPAKLVYGLSLDLSKAIDWVGSSGK